MIGGDPARPPGRVSVTSGFASILRLGGLCFAAALVLGAARHVGAEPAVAKPSEVGTAGTEASEPPTQQPSELGSAGTEASELPPAQEDGSFDRWIEELRAEALGKGISEATLNAALADVKPIERVIELDRRQPEFTQTFWGYLDKRVNDERIKRGRALLKKHRRLLRAIRRKYGVQPRFLVSFWGLESSYGDHFGGFPVVQALVTLAYDPRRSRFFRVQLIDALKILDRGDIIPEQMKGSWAGAMGQLQFIPSTFVRYAVDGDGDGKRDIWNSLPDVFATAANYLSKIGWRKGRTWGRQVRLPKKFNLDLASLKISKPLAEWQRLGVRRFDGRHLPRVAIDASVEMPVGLKGPSFLVYKNFGRILKWNRSVLYAVAVGHLADRLIGGGPFQGPRRAEDAPLSRDMVVEMQGLLDAQGYSVGPLDGILGPVTRAAIRAFQKSNKLPADGHPSVDLLARLREG